MALIYKSLSRQQDTIQSCKVTVLHSVLFMFWLSLLTSNRGSGSRVRKLPEVFVMLSQEHDLTIDDVSVCHMY